MRLSTWRPSLLAFIDRYIPPTSYFLERPEIGERNGFLPPLCNLKYKLENPGSVLANGTQDIFLTYRESGSNRYQAIDLPKYEGVYQSFSLILVSGWSAINDLTKLDLEAVPDSLMVEEIGNDPGEWLITLHWQFTATWYAEPEIDWEALKPQPVNQITSAIWRNGLDKALGDDARLDAVVTVDFT